MKGKFFKEAQALSAHLRVLRAHARATSDTQEALGHNKVNGTNLDAVMHFVGLRADGVSETDYAELHRENYRKVQEDFLPEGAVAELRKQELMEAAVRGGVRRLRQAS